LAEPEHAPAGAFAARAAERLEAGDVLLILSDEQRAQAVAGALAVAAPEARVVHMPSSDALPGDASPASPGNTGQRVAALRAAFCARQAGGRVALVTTAEAAASLHPPPAAYDVAPPIVATGEPLDAESFAETLIEIGYVADERVDEPGEMAVRGQVIDVFPADAGQPARIELAEGHIAAIRSYDPATQLSDGETDRLEVGRIAEPPLGDDAVTLFDHLPDAAVLQDADAPKRRDRHVALARDAKARVADAKRWAAALAGREPEPVAPGEPVPRFVESRNPQRAFSRFARPLLDGRERLLLVGAPRDLRFLAARAGKALGRELQPVESWAAARAAPPGALMSLAMPVDRGWRADGLTVVAAADLIGSRAALDTAGAVADPFATQASELRVGDVVVHEDFGIAVVDGLESVADGEAIALRYAGDDRRLVPVAEADRLWRYGADADAVMLDKLDGSSWEKRRGEIDAAIAESARELTRLAAERDARAAPVLDPDATAYERFAAGFPFTETADQARAIAAVRADLASGKPMDRLVIGDVGYGKTEVALRAAAIAALAGHQVAIAAPTTVLVRQHLETFRRRFEGTGVEVAGLSRLSSAAEKKRVKAGLADDSIRIVIGTGAVAAKGVDYASLALVVIDEEQRFGAADKTKLRGLGGEGTHVLALSATPIPRTLQTALVGLQQLSIIATPPARRQPIRTAIGAWDEATVRAALRREKGRGGQSFVVVSRIEDMAPMAERLRRLAPELTLVEAHGKMPVGDIDAAMVDFAAGQGDVLLATNIIEAGLDVPRANTMIVWRADRFGLSQLHQLRGRVGRGGRRGQVLLLTDPEHPIAERTVKRLKTLEAFDRLGAGFAIAARDLDMRGAGDLIGDEQAGHMKLIGVDLYQFLLAQALRAARGEPVDRWTPELNLGVAGALPAEWIPDPEIRVTLYARLARIEDQAGLDAFTDELEDRFGGAPPEARALLDVAAIRLAARDARIARIDAGPAAIALTPRPDFSGDAAAAGLAEKNGRLLLAERIEDAGERLDRVRALLDALSP
jgi:transcription-repair coupling factor (superfamily II helicase)